MRYETPRALRSALEARILAHARAHALDPSQIRRRLVFQRVLSRLADDDSWVLKGGFLLEARLPNVARTTRDLDLVREGDSAQIEEALIKALSATRGGDFFRFVITRSTPLSLDGSGLGGFRFGVDSTLDGRTFERIRIDVVERMAEVQGGTETVTIDSPITGVELGPAHVLAVDVAQHAAEKFHAMSRLYAGYRPSTRVKDLVDVVLLAEAGLLPHAHLLDRLLVVFQERDGMAPEHRLPTPPASWKDDYAAIAAPLLMSANTLSKAFAIADSIYSEALAMHTSS
jgi:hypothetical protein